MPTCRSRHQEHRPLCRLESGGSEDTVGKRSGWAGTERAHSFL